MAPWVASEPPFKERSRRSPRTTFSVAKAFAGLWPWEHLGQVCAAAYLSASSVGCRGHKCSCGYLWGNYTSFLSAEKFHDLPEPSRRSGWGCCSGLPCRCPCWGEEVLPPSRERCPGRRGDDEDEAAFPSKGKCRLAFGPNGPVAMRGWGAEGAVGGGGAFPRGLLLSHAGVEGELQTHSAGGVGRNMS